MLNDWKLHELLIKCTLDQECLNLTQLTPDRKMLLWCLVLDFYSCSLFQLDLQDVLDRLESIVLTPQEDD